MTLICERSFAKHLTVSNKLANNFVDERILMRLFNQNGDLFFPATKTSETKSKFSLDLIM